jgi:NAD-dependent deacetylase
MEADHTLADIITQNVDNLNYDAGSKVVHEFHGSLKKLICLKCGEKISISDVYLDLLPPECETCRGILKSDVIFFGEAVPKPARTHSFAESSMANCFILIGTTGTVVPANMIPMMAKSNGAKIIEINPNKSEYTDSITDVFLEDKVIVGLSAWKS